jgi:hypothetical protein
MIFTSCSILIDFCHYLCLPLDLFHFEFFWSQNFWGSLYNSLWFNGCYTWVETGPKGWIYYLACTNVANKNCVKFCMKEVFKCRERRMMRWDKLWQKLNIGDAHVTPRNIQEVQASKLGDAPRHPFFIDKYQVIFQDIIFLLLHILCVFLGASLFLLLVFFYFVCCNKWLDPNMFPLKKMHSIFHCQEHSNFHSFCSTSVLFF